MLKFPKDPQCHFKVTAMCQQITIYVIPVKSSTYHHSIRYGRAILVENILDKYKSRQRVHAKPLQLILI